MTDITRRELLKRAAVTGMTAAVARIGLGPNPVMAEGPQNNGKSRIVIVKDTSVLDGDENFRQPVIEKMLGKALAKQQGVNSAEAAWKKLFKPDDIVGIKVNCLFGRGASTHPEVAYAVVEGLKSAGVKPGNIIIWDRSSKDLRKAGYTPTKEGAPLVLADDGDWGRHIKNGTFDQKISKILDRITAIVNVPILKDHGGPGVSISMKNHYGTCSDPSALHPNNGNPYMADLNGIPDIKDKTRLVVVDAIIPQCEGGPGLKPKYLWKNYSLMVGTDFVAVDRVGADIIDARRRQVGVKSLAEAGREPKWIATAANMGLGTDDPNKIEIIRV